MTRIQIEPKALKVLEIVRDHFGDNIALGGGAVIDTILKHYLPDSPGPSDYDIQVFIGGGWYV